MDKEDRREFVKLFIRLIEITFTVLIAAPAALLILKAEISMGQYLLSFGIALVVILIFGVIAIKISKR